MATYDLTLTTPSNIVVGDILNCPYSGTYKSITLPLGTYKLECWGALGNQASSVTGNTPGKGGYSVGTLTLFSSTTVYIRVGGQSGFNGGGTGTANGGGASDIRVLNDSYNYRIIVAGGGGGAGYHGTDSGNTYGDGGGTSGIDYYTIRSGNYKRAGGGTATSGGTSTGTYGGTQGNSGSFGTGGTGPSTSGTQGSGGGGGWYGGSSGQAGNSSEYGGGGGGSGYVYTSSTYSLHPYRTTLGTTYYLTDAQTIAGNTSFPSTSGSAETGHSGNGYVRITVINSRKIKTEIHNFSYTGNVLSITLKPGTHKLECWGALGGDGTYNNSKCGNGGKGGYSVGTLILTSSLTVYIYVGGSGIASASFANGGFNGGGNTGTGSSGNSSGGSGGGASDIRIGSTSLYARVIVAGGGGGCGVYTDTSSYGGYGGGTSGGSAYNHNYSTRCSSPGTSTSGGAAGTSGEGSGITAGSFGLGGTGSTYSTGGGAGGGGGWYGGGGANGGGPYAGSAGGGSGYVYTSSTYSNYPSGCLLNYNYYLTGASTTNGGNSFPSTSGSTETGHTGNGYIRITSTYYLNLPLKIKQNGEWKDISKGYTRVSGLWKEIDKVFRKVSGEWIEEN